MNLPFVKNDSIRINIFGTYKLKKCKIRKNHFTFLYENYIPHKNQENAKPTTMLITKPTISRLAVFDIFNLLCYYKENSQLLWTTTSSLSDCQFSLFYEQLEKQSSNRPTNYVQHKLKPNASFKSCPDFTERFFTPYHQALSLVIVFLSILIMDEHKLKFFPLICA